MHGHQLQSPTTCTDLNYTLLLQIWYLLEINPSYVYFVMCGICMFSNNRTSTKTRRDDFVGYAPINLDIYAGNKKKTIKLSLVTKY